MAQLTVKTLDRTGSWGNLTDQAEAAAALGDYFENDGFVLLAVLNSSGGSLRVAFAFGVRATIDGITPTGPVVTVGAGKTQLLGAWLPYDYNDAGGRVQLTYPDGVTGLKVLAFKAAGVL